MQDERIDARVAPIPIREPLSKHSFAVAVNLPQKVFTVKRSMYGDLGYEDYCSIVRTWVASPACVGDPPLAYQFAGTGRGTILVNSGWTVRYRTGGEV